jgi:hypothetical protein
MAIRQYYIGIFCALVIGITSSCTTGDLVLKGGHLQIILGSNGQITSLIDSNTKIDYLAEGESNL